MNLMPIKTYRPRNSEGPEYKLGSVNNLGGRDYELIAVSEEDTATAGQVLRIDYYRPLRQTVDIITEPMPVRDAKYRMNFLPR